MLRFGEEDVCQDYMQVCCSNATSMRYELVGIW